MKLQNMFGVVLWSDASAQNAVIWCEDQGELAYYTPGDGCIHDAPSLDAGDLVQFDVTVQENVRKATNPQILMQSHSPDLPQKLRAGQRVGANDMPAQRADTSKKVVDLSDYFGAQPARKFA
ncbi:hypothetical protein [Marivita sp.]|jgi:hypothetical protein|uniref:hypothetical protein n=1 Tax=Marivita sp. TaxID=2003365 RepID=UPI003F727F87